MISRPTRRTTRIPTLAALVTVALALACSALPVYADGAPRTGATTPSAALVSVVHGSFTLSGRPLPPLHGINYEGPSDRPWRMWQDGLFSPTLIARDFDAIAAAGYNPVRIFIQHPLPSMILDGGFSRLDTVVALAAARGLRLLVTFNDDGDRDLRRVAHVEALVAAHLSGNPAVFGYDLRNEPGLADIVGAIYPTGAPLPLLSQALVKAYGERVSMAAARAAQRTAPWSSGAFTSFDTRTLYYYLNASHLLDSFLRDNPGYPAVAATPYWTTFLSLASRTLATYLAVQMRAIRAADPSHVITVGYNSRFWSALPANTALDFRSIHIYPPADFDGFHAALQRFEALNALASSPLVLEEYGVSNDLTGPQSSAVCETAAALYLRTLGGAGDIKWMFDDDAAGYNAYENNLGAVDIHGLPKPTYLASSAADAYWAHTPYSGGLSLQPDPVTNVGFVYNARDALAIGGSLPYADGRVTYTPSGPGVLWLDWSIAGVLRVLPTASGTLTVALGTLANATGLVALPPPVTATPLPSAMPTVSPAVTQTTTATTIATTTATATLTTTATTTATVSLTPTLVALPTATATTAGGATAGQPRVVARAVTVKLALKAGVPRVIIYRPGGTLPPPPIDLPAPNLGTGWYMVERGHNVAAPFLTPWLRLGGAAAVGLPLTEAFAYNGLPTQYFDDVALRVGPQGLTTAPIGVVALNGARPRARELPKSIPHVYDRATGHNIHGFFLDYWRRHGGLAFWGDPLTEEMTEHGRLVQYFSGAEFTLTAGPHADVALLPLGRRMWPTIRHVYGL